VKTRLSARQILRPKAINDGALHRAELARVRCLFEKKADLVLFQKPVNDTRWWPTPSSWPGPNRVSRFAASRASIIGVSPTFDDFSGKYRINTWPYCTGFKKRFKCPTSILLAPSQQISPALEHSRPQLFLIVVGQGDRVRVKSCRLLWQREKEKSGFRNS